MINQDIEWINSNYFLKSASSFRFASAALFRAFPETSFDDKTK
jgi:hypothetical protein